MRVSCYMLLLAAFQQLMTSNNFNAEVGGSPIPYAFVPLQQGTLMQNDLPKSNIYASGENYSMTTEESNEEDHNTTIEDSSPQPTNAQNINKNKSLSFVNTRTWDSFRSSSPRVSEFMEHFSTQPTPTEKQAFEQFSRPMSTDRVDTQVSLNSASISPPVKNNVGKIFMVNTSLSPEMTTTFKSPKASEIQLPWEGTSRPSNSAGPVFLESLSTMTLDKKLSLESTSTTIPSEITDIQSLTLDMSRPSLPETTETQILLEKQQSSPSQLEITDISASRSSSLVTNENQTSLKSNESQIPLRNISRKLSQENTENIVALENVTKHNPINTQMSGNGINSPESTSMLANVTKSPQIKMLDHTASDQANDSHFDTVTFPSTFTNFTDILRSSGIDSANMTKNSTTENLPITTMINNSDTNSRAINETKETTMKMNISDHKLQNNFMISNSSLLHITPVTGHSDSKISKSNETMSNDHLKHSSSTNTYEHFANSSNYTTPAPKKSGNISILTARSKNMFPGITINTTNSLSQVRMQNEDIKSKTTPLNFSNRATPPFNDSGYIMFIEDRISNETNGTIIKHNISYSGTNSPSVGSIYNTFLTDIATMNNSEDAPLVKAHSISKWASLIGESPQRPISNSRKDTYRPLMMPAQISLVKTRAPSKHVSTYTSNSTLTNTTETQLPETENTITVDPVLETTSILPKPKNVSTSGKALTDWKFLCNITSHYLIHQDFYIKTENLTELEKKEDTLAITFKYDFEYAEWFLKYYPEFKSYLAKSISWNSEIQKKWGLLHLHDEILHVTPGPFKVKNTLVANIVVRNPIDTEGHKYIPGQYLLECLKEDKYYMEKSMKIEISNISVGIYIEPEKEFVKESATSISKSDGLSIGLYVLLSVTSICIILILGIIYKKLREYLVPPLKPPRMFTHLPVPRIVGQHLASDRECMHMERNLPTIQEDNEICSFEPPPRISKQEHEKSVETYDDIDVQDNENTVNSMAQRSLNPDIEAEESYYDIPTHGINLVHLEGIPEDDEN